MPPETLSSSFCPQKVFVNKEIQELPYTKNLFLRLGAIECKYVNSPDQIDKLGSTEKGLFLTKYNDWPLKQSDTISKSTGRPTYPLNLISNCHLECTYCVLQSYFEAPIITLAANIKEVLDKLSDQIDRMPRGSVISMGQMGDSLALEELTQLNQKLIPFFAEQDRIQLELKTKSDAIAPLLKLKHNRQTVISWSLVPERVRREEEPQTAPIDKRIAAMAACQKADYPIGIHLDPIVHHTGWEKNYKKLIDQVFSHIDPKGVSWVSMAPLHFPVQQTRLMKERFPKNRKIFLNLTSTQRRFMSYPDRLCESIDFRIKEYLSRHVSDKKVYTSTEVEQLDSDLQK